MVAITWNLNLPPLDMVIDAREAFRSSIFRENFITACWAIWLTKNDVIFDHGHVNLDTWKRKFKEEFGYVCTRAKPAKQVELNLWRDSHL